MRLARTSMVPPKPDNAPSSIWAVWIVSTKSWVTGGDWQQLLDNFHKHLISNHQDVPADLSAHLQNLICQAAPANWPGCKSLEGKRYLGWEDFRRWIRSMKGLFGGSFAPQEEAERRAEICSGCRYQTEISGFCSVCQGIGAELLSLISGKSTSRDSELKSCQFCGCKNAAAVHFPLDVLQKASAGIEYPLDTKQNGQEPVPCWKV